MSPSRLHLTRVKQLLRAANRSRILVVGDVMLDQFIWGSVARISPEAPVPVLDFERESYMPGGAANVARNLVALGPATALFGIIGRDYPGMHLQRLLREHRIESRGLTLSAARSTSMKTRIVAQMQQVVRVDRETRETLDARMTDRLLSALRASLAKADAVIVGDYGKGVVTERLLSTLKRLCRRHGVWLSMDPKPIHAMNLTGLSLITPNRKEAFELAGISDDTRHPCPLEDEALRRAAQKLLNQLQPAVLLITLGELGMLLCQRRQKPIHIPTVAQEVFDVSGAGDTVIAAFTAAIAAGASPVEAAIIANHAAGIVVGKIGTATVTPEELLTSFDQ